MCTFYDSKRGVYNLAGPPPRPPAQPETHRASAYVEPKPMDHGPA